MDGRSDFYGPDIGKLYLRILYGDPKGREALDRYGVGVVLAVKSWPLAHLLRASEGWRVVDEESTPPSCSRVRVRSPAGCAT